MDNEDLIAKAMQTDRTGKGVIVCVDDFDRRQFERHRQLQESTNIDGFAHTLHWDEDEFTFDATKHAEMMKLFSSLAITSNYPKVVPNIQRVMGALMAQQAIVHNLFYGDVGDALRDYQTEGIGIKSGGYKSNEMIVVSGRRIGRTYQSLLNDRLRESIRVKSEPIDLGVREMVHASHYSTDGYHWREQRPVCTLHMEPGQLRDSSGRLRFYKPQRSGIWSSV